MAKIALLCLLAFVAMTCANPQPIFGNKKGGLDLGGIFGNKGGKKGGFDIGSIFGSKGGKKGGFNIGSKKSGFDLGKIFGKKGGLDIGSKKGGFDIGMKIAPIMKRLRSKISKFTGKFSKKG